MLNNQVGDKLQVMVGREQELCPLQRMLVNPDLVELKCIERIETEHITV